MLGLMWVATLQLGEKGVKVNDDAIGLWGYEENGKWVWGVDVWGNDIEQWLHSMRRWR